MTVSAPAAIALAMSPEYCTPPSPITRHAGRLARLRGLVDGGDLRHADAGHDPGRADRAGPTPTLTASAPASIRACAPALVATLPPMTSTRELALTCGDHVEHACGVAVRGVHDEEVNARLDQRLRPPLGVLADADGRADDEPALGVLGRVRELLALGEVLDRDQPAQPAGVVDQRQLLDLVAAEQAQRLRPGDADRSGHQRHRRHDLGDPAPVVGLEPDVAVGDDADQHAVRVGDRHAGDPVARAQLLDVGDGRVRAAGHRIGDHPGLGPLDHVDLLGLLLDGHVPVQHADAALAGHGDGHPRLGHGVHGGGEQRDPQRQPRRQPGRGVRFAGHYDLNVPAAAERRRRSGRAGRTSRRSSHVPGPQCWDCSSS